MKLLNRYGLPDEFVRALRRGFRRPDTRPPNTISVTELLTPPQVRYLEKLHWKDLRIEASDLVWRLLGQAVHAILEWGYVPVDALDAAEEDMTELYDGVEITGRLDLYEGAHRRISDYKVTSVWTLKNPHRIAEWEAQLNLYAWFLRNGGIPVEEIRIVAILRDWSRGEQARVRDYPEAPVVVVPIPLWEQDEAEDLLKRRLEIHRRSWEGDVRPCTNRERWKQDDRWQVYKREGSARPSKTFTVKEEAEAWLRAHPDHILRFVPGEPSRCINFCSVADFCPQWQQERQVYGY